MASKITKFCFLSFIIILFLWMVSLKGLHWETQVILKNIKSYGIIDFTEVSKTLINLWKPISVSDLSLPVDLAVSDRIAEQLEWTKLFFESKNFGNVSGKSLLLVYSDRELWEFWDTENKINCPGFSISRKMCKLTLIYNFEEQNVTLEDFDALIYAQDSNFPKELVPEHVKQIIYTHEPPGNVTVELQPEVLLASYYRGSDIVTSYSKWVAFEDEKIKNFNVKEDTYEKMTMDFSNGKSKLAVTFVSDCDTNNNRLDYISELQKYISVDIFGDCGTTSPCNAIHSHSVCVKKIVRKYKFYLAFEKSNCRDYITSHFFENSLKNEIVPVVMGAHPNDYLYAAPPKSYINVEDFPSPKHLADYLMALDKDNAQYNEYFRWKDTGVFYAAWKDLFCRICGMLFYFDYVRPPLWKENATWTDIDTCLPKGRWYWNRS